MWALGCILYTLLCGYPAFYGDDDQEILGKVQRGEYSFDGPEWEIVTKDAKDLIKKLIAKPEKRLTATEALGHKWMVKNNRLDKRKLAKMTQVKQFKLMGTRRCSNLVHQSAMHAVALMASPDDIKNLKSLFLQLDVNGDGTLTIPEITEGLKELGFDPAQKETMLENIKLADTDGSGEIDYTEFIAATMSSKMYMNEKYLRAAFDMFDKDGSGKVSGEEILRLLQGDTVQTVASTDAVKKAMESIDENGDGELDFEEFKHMMSKCIDGSSCDDKK